MFIYAVQNPSLKTATCKSLMLSPIMSYCNLIDKTWEHKQTNKGNIAYHLIVKKNGRLKKCSWTKTRWNRHGWSNNCRWTNSRSINFRNTETCSRSPALRQTTMGVWFLIRTKQTWLQGETLLKSVNRLSRHLLTQTHKFSALFTLIMRLVGAMFTKKIREWPRAEFFIQEAWHECSWAWCGRKQPFLQEGSVVACARHASPQSSTTEIIVMYYHISPVATSDCLIVKLS